MFFSTDLLRELPSKFVSISTMIPKSVYGPPKIDPEKIFFSMSHDGTIRLSAGLLGDYKTCDIQYNSESKQFRVKVGNYLPISVRNSSVNCSEFTKQFNYVAPKELLSGRVKIIVECNSDDGWYYSKDVPEYLFNK